MTDDDDTREAETRRDVTERDSDTAHASTMRSPVITKLAESVDSPPPRERRSSQLDLAIGEKLGGRYVVRGFLGMGGMGAVYHVFDETLGEDVALKAVRSAIATTSGLRDEVKIAQKVTHENVCRTYDLEDVDGRHFVKMEYVAGQTLADRIEQGRLPVDEAIRIARAVVAGLSAAHARGIVHRDLKPGNVMLDGARVLLMDFGLALYASHSDADRAGTPGYMSPEQLAGVALDHRSDLFSLGCLLHEMLTGERVYGVGSMTEIANRQSSIEIPDARAKRPEIPKWLARATALLLSQDRGRRPAGLALLNRGPASKAPIAIAVVGVVVVGAGIAWVALRPAAKPWQAHVEVIRKPGATTELTTRMSVAPDGASFVYIREAIGETGVVERTAISGLAPPQRLFDAAGGHQIRHLRDGSGFAMCGGEDEAHEIYTLDHAGRRRGYGRGAEPDDCGDALVAVREVAAGEAYQWELVEIAKRDGATRALLRGAIGQVIEHPRCDAAGQRVVFSMFEAEQPAIFMLERRDGTKTRIAVGETPIFGTDRTVIYSANGKLIERDLVKSTELVLTPDDGSYFAPELAPDGNTLLYQREDHFAALYLGGPSVRNREGIAIPHERLKIRRALMTRDRMTIVIQRVAAHPSIVAIDVATGRLTPLVEGEEPFLSHDDREVYFVGERPSVLRAIPITGGASRLVIELPKAQIRDGHDAEDAIHLGLASPSDALPKAGGKLRAVRLPHGTQQIVDEGSGLAIPAPRGPWIARALGFDHELSAGDDRVRRIRCYGPSAWLDDHRFGCSVAPRRLEIVDVTDDSRKTIELPWLDRFSFLAADGEHWIAVRESNAITQLAITNFADRLR